MSESSQTVAELDEGIINYIRIFEEGMEIKQSAQDIQTMEHGAAAVAMQDIIDRMSNLTERHNQFIEDYAMDPETFVAMKTRLDDIDINSGDDNTGVMDILNDIDSALGHKVAENPEFYVENQGLTESVERYIDAVSKRDELFHDAAKNWKAYQEEQNATIDVVVSDALARDCGVEECTDAEEAIQALQERYNAAEAAISDDTMSPMDKLEVYTDYLDGYKETLTSLGERGVPEEIAEESVSRLIGIPPDGLSDKGADYQEVLAGQVRDMVSMADNIEITGSAEERADLAALKVEMYQTSLNVLNGEQKNDIFHSDMTELERISGYDADYIREQLELTRDYDSAVAEYVHKTPEDIPQPKEKPPEVETVPKTENAELESVTPALPSSGVSAPVSP